MCDPPLNSSHEVWPSPFGAHFHCWPSPLRPQPSPPPQEKTYLPLETGMGVGYFQITISEQRKWSFNNRVFLSRVYRLIVAPRKFIVLKTDNNSISEASRFYMSDLRTSNFQGEINYLPMHPETNTPLFLLFNTKRFSHKTCPFESSVHQVWVFKWKAA